MQHACRNAVLQQPDRAAAASHTERAAAAPIARQGARPGGPAPAALPAGIDSSPRLVAQRRQIAQHFGGVVVQRLLRTHEKKSDEGTLVDSTGDKGFINDYARWMAQDSAALVEGEPKGVKGLLKTLKAGAFDGGAVAAELRASLLGSGAWRAVDGKDMSSLVQAVAEASGSEPDREHGETDDQFIIAMNVVSDYPEALDQWIDGRLAPLAMAETVGTIEFNRVPSSWHGDMAYLVYEATKTAYFGPNLYVYTPPFKELIAKVDAGEVARFDYVRKYGGAAQQNWGAEFTVAAPAELSQKFAGKAVLHTHYPAAQSAPNYAHTKPEEKKFEPGFGYTVVDTGRVRGVQQTASAWNALP